MGIKSILTYIDNPHNKSITPIMIVLTVFGVISMTTGKIDLVFSIFRIMFFPIILVTSLFYTYSYFKNKNKNKKSVKVNKIEELGHNPSQGKFSNLGKGIIDKLEAERLIKLQNEKNSKRKRQIIESMKLRHKEKKRIP